LICNRNIPLPVRQCKDFAISGKGDNNEWQKTEWTNLQKLDKGGENYLSQFKILYSSGGIYVLFSGEDLIISSDFENDFDPLFKGDVFEVFFHPDPSESLYFEYEISSLEKELVLLMVKRDKLITGWNPWPYGKENGVLKKVNLVGGTMKAYSPIESWTAELFIPYKLLCAFNNTPPAKQTLWYANFCRLDYDTGKMIRWAWAPVETSFHETQHYLPLLFE